MKLWFLVETLAVFNKSGQICEFSNIHFQKINLKLKTADATDFELLSHLKECHYVLWQFFIIYDRMQPYIYKIIYPKNRLNQFRKLIKIAVHRMISQINVFTRKSNVGINKTRAIKKRKTKILLNENNKKQHIFSHTV